MQEYKNRASQTMHSNGNLSHDLLLKFFFYYGILLSKSSAFTNKNIFQKSCKKGRYEFCFVLNSNRKKCHLFDDKIIIKNFDRKSWLKLPFECKVSDARFLYSRTQNALF